MASRQKSHSRRFVLPGELSLQVSEPAHGCNQELTAPNISCGHHDDVHACFALLPVPPPKFPRTLSEFNEKKADEIAGFFMR
jgi:hypothetical protein